VVVFFLLVLQVPLWVGVEHMAQCAYVYVRRVCECVLSCIISVKRRVGQSCLRCAPVSQLSDASASTSPSQRGDPQPEATKPEGHW